MNAPIREVRQTLPTFGHLWQPELRRIITPHLQIPYEIVWRARVCGVFEFVRRWKGESAFSFRRRYGRELWQRAYYDHILRPKELPGPFAWYIWLNPVRKGLCKEPKDYPWSGSLTMDWKKSTPPTEEWIPPWKEKPEIIVGEGALDPPAVRPGFGV